MWESWRKEAGGEMEYDYKFKHVNVMSVQIIFKDFNPVSFV